MAISSGTVGVFEGEEAGVAGGAMKFASWPQAATKGGAIMIKSGRINKNTDLLLVKFKEYLQFFLLPPRIHPR